jgi:hypothetical protein
MMAGSEAVLRSLCDRQDIVDLIARYALGQDSHQGDDKNVLEQWDDIFAPDAITDYSSAGAPACPYRDLARWMRGDDGSPGRMSSFSNWQHMLSLPVINLNGDTATARTDFLATHRAGTGEVPPYHFNASGAFHDNLVRTPQGWRISNRRLEVYFGDKLAIVADIAQPAAEA